MSLSKPHNFIRRQNVNHSAQGLTLAEMLISMGLIGAVLIPMLFISSAVFLRQISDSRENVDVIQNASHVINILSNDLQKVHRILPGSSSSEVHYASYDGRTGKESLRGFKITVVSGSNYKLERLDYNTTTDTWVAKSPYGPLAADDITLQKTGGGAPTFGYCLDTACTGATSVSANPEKSVLLQLDDWVFTRGSDSSSITLPDVNIHLASDSSLGGYLLSEGVRELYTIDTSIASSVGTGNPLTAISLTPGGGQFNYPDQSGGGGWAVGSSGTLSTIVNNGAGFLGVGFRPGASTIATAPDGRVYFGQNSSPGNFYTWKDNTLSTIITGQSRPGYISTATDSTGRVFFGEESNGDSFFTWKDGVLSTLVSSANYPGVGSTFVASDDAVYFGATNNGYMFRWKDGVLSTITSDSGQQSGRYSIREAPDGRMYFGSGSTVNGEFWSWKDNVLSTILTGANSPGTHSTRVDSTGRVYFGTGENGNNCQDPNTAAFGTMYSWKDNVLSTILTGLKAPGCSSTVVGSNDNVMFAHMEVWTGASSYTFIWKDNVLSTLHSQAGNSVSVYNFSSDMSENGRFYYNVPLTTNWSNMVSWKDGVLSTLGTNNSDSFGYWQSMMSSPVDDRVFIGSISGFGPIHTWHDNVLSTLMTGLNSPGRENMSVSPYGRAFWGNVGTGNLYTWYDTTGLSTILPSNLASVAAVRSIHISPYDGSVFFGTNTNPGYFWRWHDGSSLVGGGNVIRLDNSGNKNNQDVTVAAQSAYDYSVQDIDGEFYFMNATDGELHRYTWAGGTSSYTIATSFTMGGFASDVVAMAIDQAEDTIAFLDKDAVQPNIQIYANRKAASTPALTTKTLGALGSKEPDNPTGLAINGRNGDFLILDSDQKGSNPNYYVNLLVIDPTVSRVKKTFKIYTKNTNTKIPISSDLSAETNFKIHYDDAKNIVYLVSPSTEKIIPMTLPEFLE